MKQLCFEDEDRVLLNNMEGNYASATQRALLASTASQNYYVKLKTLFDQTHYSLLADQHSVQLKIYMDSLTNLVEQSTGVGTPVATINSVNLIAKITRLPLEIASNRLSLMARKPEDSIFHSLRYGTFTINSGVTSANIVLTPIVGSVAMLIFVIRTSTALTQGGFFNYNALANFAIIDAGGSNCVGGQVIASQLCLQYLMGHWSRSSYTSETSIGSNLAGTLVNNGANVYAWSFSSSPQEALKDGLLLGSRRFIGSEQLQLTFPSALAANVQVDVFALTESMLKQDANTVRVMAL
jgi:hypothetical protein